ncbi:hypothetical protein PRIPAC_79146 [Pristionchus pacificus]|uniref:Uncharacterized protein n=1 Tax=Pristionchus pacificus TaxID=54126 RepID=A0A454XIN8_PRIPA|nr:hypothetical protein PRIPAC_79146 [Pristionchus pacificus]|eukprot:PDM70809.1 hypothetical protein PRIPAC_45013 [Pristionchus pacificus]
MRTVLGIWLFLATNIHAESLTVSSSVDAVSTSTTVAPSINTVDLDSEQLSTISSACLSRQEHEQMAGRLLRFGMVRTLNWRTAQEEQETIGLPELRAVAGFPRPGWTAYKESTDDEIAAAPTVEKYYELREPRSNSRSLDSYDLLERNLPPAIDFLDARFPRHSGPSSTTI